MDISSACCPCILTGILFERNAVHCRYEIKYSPIKYIETTERGLVVITVNEADGGRYDCYLGGSLLCSYSITVDAHRYEATIIDSNST